MALRSLLAPVTAALVALLVVAAGVGVVFVDPPKTTDVDSEFGRVTDERTEVRTRVTVEDPTLLRVGEPVADVEYTVSMNDVQMAHEREEAVDLSRGRNVVQLSTWLDNDDVPQWWVTHVENGERTTVEVDPTVSVDRLGVAVESDSLTRTRTFETDLLAPLQSNETRSLQAFDRTILQVERTTAEWGEPTADETPVHASMTVRNPLSVPVPVSKLSYVVEMNGVVVGEGSVGERTLVSPDSTETIPANFAIDNSRLDEWWVTHVRRNQTSQMTVQFAAQVELGDRSVRLPLGPLSFQQTFETDVLGSGEVRTNGSESAGAGDQSNDPPSRWPDEWPPSEAAVELPAEERTREPTAE